MKCLHVIPLLIIFTDKEHKYSHSIVLSLPLLVNLNISQKVKIVNLKILYRVLNVYPKNYA